MTKMYFKPWGDFVPGALNITLVLILQKTNLVFRESWSTLGVQTPPELGRFCWLMLPPQTPGLRLLYNHFPSALGHNPTSVLRPKQVVLCCRTRTETRQEWLRCSDSDNSVTKQCNKMPTVQGCTFGGKPFCVLIYNHAPHVKLFCFLKHQSQGFPWSVLTHSLLPSLLSAPWARSVPAARSALWLSWLAGPQLWDFSLAVCFCLNSGKTPWGSTRMPCETRPRNSAQ